MTKIQELKIKAYDTQAVINGLQAHINKLGAELEMTHRQVAELHNAETAKANEVVVDEAIAEEDTAGTDVAKE